ncbi:hypothetical protein ACWCXH_13240 [Kitasatospora sp. NPDC001660]
MVDSTMQEGELATQMDDSATECHQGCVTTASRTVHLDTCATFSIVAVVPLFRFRGGVPGHRLIHIGYAVAGAYFGWRWAFVEHGPAWQRALHALALMAVLAALAQAVRWQRRRRRGPAGPLRLPLRNLILGKLLLVVLALGAGLILDRWTPDAQLIVGAGLFLAIALGGPALHRWHAAMPAAVPSPTETAGGIHDRHRRQPGIPE